MKRVPGSSFPKKQRRIVVVRKQYATITKKGLEFVKDRYSRSVQLAQEEIKLYGFLMRLISLGGILPLSSIKRWGLMGALRNATKNEYTLVTRSKQELPKKEVQQTIREIWGEIPGGFCV